MRNTFFIYFLFQVLNFDEIPTFSLFKLNYCLFYFIFVRVVSCTVSSFYLSIHPSIHPSIVKGEIFLAESVLISTPSTWFCLKWNEENKSFLMISIFSAGWWAGGQREAERTLGLCSHICSPFMLFLFLINKQQLIVSLLLCKQVIWDWSFLWDSHTPTLLYLAAL